MQIQNPTAVMIARTAVAQDEVTGCEAAPRAGLQCLRRRRAGGVLGGPPLGTGSCRGRLRAAPSGRSSSVEQAPLRFGLRKERSLLRGRVGCRLRALERACGRRNTMCTCPFSRPPPDPTHGG